MDDLDQLYQTIILDHYRQPRNRRSLNPDEVQADEENPLCGDQVQLTVVWDGDRIRAIHFDGRGCAISQASASLMTQELEGLTAAEARQRIEAFIAVLRGEREWDPAEHDELNALVGVRKFPLRVKCATLSWRGMERILQDRDAQRS